jgi:RNA polymerase sigma-70 factor, ECF subfamily
VIASPLQRFVAAEYERLLRLACLITANTADAADAVVRGLDEGWRRQAKLGDESRLRVWLDQLVVREAVRLADRPSLLSLVGRNSGIAWIEPADPDGPNGRDASEWHEVQASFDALPTEQRAALALHHYAGYSIEEVADLVDAPTEIVMARVRLGTERLRAELRELASFRPRRDRAPDDIVAQLTAFLQWRAEHLRGLPTAAQITARVAEAPARRRAERGPRLAWTAIGVVTVLVGVFLLGPRPTPLPVVAMTETSPAGPAASTVPQGLVGPPPAPIPTHDLAACSTTRVGIDGPDNHPLPAAAATLVAPKGMQLATVVQSNAYSGDIVVAGERPGSALVIGSFSGARLGAFVDAKVWAWTSDASSVLVELSQAGSDGADEERCENLFVVRGYGVTPITDNGPGSVLDEAALILSSTGHGVFYLSGTTLHSVSADDSDRSFNLPGCEWRPQLTVVSPDGNSIAFDCVQFPGSDVLIYNIGVADLQAGTLTLTQLQRANQPSIGMTWTGPRSLLIALAEDTASPADKGRILLRDGVVGATGVTFKPRVASTYRTEWLVPAASFSPDGNWLLSVGDADTAPDPYNTFLINTHTGATRKLPWPVVNDRAPTLAFPMWLTGRRPRVLMMEDEHLYEVDLLAPSRTDLGAIPRVEGGPNANFVVVPTPVGVGG